MSHNRILLGGNHAGLGGRLKTIAWGKTLATLTNLDYKFIWPLSDACGGITLNPSVDLFSNVDFYIPSTPWLAHDDWMKLSAPEKKIARINAMQSYATEFTNRNADSDVAIDFSQENDSPFQAFAKKYGVLLQYLGAGVVLPQKHLKSLHEKYIRELQNLTPADEILNRVHRITDKYDLTSCLGVHVRRGDVEELGNKFKGLMKRYVPEEQYFNILDNADKKKYSDILLCTESEDVIESFKNRYGSRIIHQPLVANHRGSINGVQDAYAEILLLSKCKCIIGGRSNFSELAALIGGTDIHLLQQ